VGDQPASCAQAGELPRLQEIDVDLRVFGFTLGVSILTV
jgi:hypothetical protein